MRISYYNNLLHKLGPEMAPFIFLSVHFAFFFVCHLFSMICLYNFYWHTFSILFWLTWSIWNGSCFYMDYFSKKYEISLQRLEEVEQEAPPAKTDVDVDNSAGDFNGPALNYQTKQETVSTAPAPAPAPSGDTATVGQHFLGVLALQVGHLELAEHRLDPIGLGLRRHHHQ